MTPEVKKRITQIQQGEVPEGYKKESVGIIPNSWNKDYLSSAINTLLSGVSVNSDENIDTGIYILKTSAISNGKVNLNEAKCVVAKEISRVKCPVAAGSILISRMNTPMLVGECGYVQESSNAHFLPDRLWQAVNTNPDKYNYKWLNYLLNSPRYRTAIHNLATGTSNSMKNISKEQFLALAIPVPSLEIQQRIAEILTTQDRVIELKEKLIAGKQRQKKYLMQQLLTGKKRLPGFNKEWKSVRSDTVFRNVSNKDHGETLEVLSSTQDRGVIPRNQVDIDIKYDKSSLSSYKKVEIGNFIISLRSFQGGIEYSGYEGLVSPAYTVLAPKVPIVDDFYKQFFKSQNYINRLNVAVYGIRDGKQISYSDFGRLAIPFPPLEEQTAIAEILSAADREIELLQQELEQEKQKKKALMQLLLTGIVRVSQ